MAVLDQQRLYSAEELWELSHNPVVADLRLELLDGELKLMPPSTGIHGGSASTLNVYLGIFVLQHKIGYLTTAETGYVLHKNPSGRDTVYAPDIGFVLAERLPDGLPDEYIPFAPDLAVEVVSKNDSAEEVLRKVNNYLKYGTQLVWVVYPRLQQIVVHTQDGARTLSREDTLEGGAVLPGFSLALSDFFK